MRSEFFSSLDLVLQHKNIYGAYKPITLGGAEEYSNEPYVNVEARDKLGTVVMRGFNGSSVARAICDIMLKRHDVELDELDKWVLEGNSFIFTKIGATRLQLFKGTDTRELVKSYGGDDPEIAYVNYVSNQPPAWR